MSTNSSTLATLGRHLILALQPLRHAVLDKERFRALLYQLGWNPTDLPPSYAALATVIDDATAKVEALDEGPTPEQVIDLLASVKKAYQAIRSISIAPPGVDASVFLGEIGERLFEHLLTQYLAAAVPRVYRTLQMLNVIETESVSASAGRSSFIRTKFKWGEIPRIITEPDELPKRVYGWGTNSFHADRAIDHLGELLVALHFPVRTERPAERLVRAYAGIGSAPIPLTSASLIAPFFYLNIGGQAHEAALVLHALPASNGQFPGLVIEPQIPSEFPLLVTASDEISLRVRTGTNIATTLGILVRPGDASIKYPFQAGTTPPAAGVGIGFDFAPSTPTLLFGAPKATRLEFQGASADFSAETKAGELDIVVSAQLEKFALVLAAGEGDSFLNAILSGGERRIEFPLGIEWSRRNGIHFLGSGGFETVIKTNLRLGPITVEAIAFQILTPADHSADITLAVGVNMTGQLGPITFAVEGLGLAVETTFSPGNLGPFNMQLGFKPPTGLGLAIATAGVTGGGFLGFDPQRAEYSGMLQLELAETIAIKALGLLTTKLPDGSKGYSLVILLTAEGFAPIPIGLGFTLTGIGGLVALHRTVRTDVLREGLKTGTLNAVLFPPDPLRNAPQIFSDLRRVFPPTAGRHVVGPMVQLRWGTPTLLTLDLALLVELPAPVRVVVLGRLQVLLPNQTHPLIQIRMDALGVLDVSAETVSLDATLYDSRILQFTLTGDMALRAGWGRQPQFVLAIGGFHPRFAPPPGLPALQRLALQLADGDSLQLRCQAYLAVTSNTVQFGARVDLHAAGGGFSFDGMLGFDAIIQLAPLAFEVDVGAALALRYRGRLLVGVSFKGRLAGPTPWQVEGKASIKLLFFSVSVSFSRTFGSKTAPPLPAAVDVVGLIAAALADRRNWSGAVPRSSAPVVTIRETAPPTNGLRVHPWAELTLRERIAPLNRRLMKLGTAPLVGGPTTVTVTLTDRAGAQPWRTTPVSEPFALAQYEDLREDEQLAQPAFVPLQGGLTVAADDLAVDDEAGLATPIAYETVLIDPTRPPERPTRGYVLSAAVLARVAPFGAAGQAPARKRRRANALMT
ncbi:MAG: hypothetical protein KA240_11495 [Nitrospira sp.]|nr:hypothetical protein [Nitrospira sp.]